MNTAVAHLLGGLAYQFENLSYLEIALTHRSASGRNNERSEFLGDAVLGFVIAEADLEIRGEGDLYGTHQSGSERSHRVANIIQHAQQIIWAKEDVENLIEQNNPLLFKKMQQLQTDMKIFSTI